MIKGVEVELGGQKRILAPLNLNQVEQLESEIEKFQAGQTTSELIKAAKKILHASLSRNYPAMTEEEVGELIDMSTFVKCVKAALSMSGFKEGEGASEGGQKNA